jgi:hypothetical protein
MRRWSIHLFDGQVQFLDENAEGFFQISSIAFKIDNRSPSVDPELVGDGA